MRPSQQAWRTANVLGKNGAKYLGYAKFTGVGATFVGFGLSVNNIASGEGTAIDYVDAGVAVTAIGSAIFLASNPVGWVISTGAAVYFAGRLAYDVYNEFKD